MTTAPTAAADITKLLSERERLVAIEGWRARVTEIDGRPAQGRGVIV